MWLWFSLVLSAAVYVSMARLWTDTSMPRLEGAEAALLKAYGKVRGSCRYFRVLLCREFDVWLMVDACTLEVRGRVCLVSSLPPASTG